MFCFVFVCFFKYKADLRLLRVFFTTTCRYRVIKRSHSCLKHSVCSVGQVSLQTNDSVWSRCFSRPPLRTFMFSPKPSFRSRPSDWLLLSLLAHHASRAPNSGMDRNGCVTVKLVSFFHVEFKRGLSRLLLLLRQSSPSLCLIENRPAPVGGC